ncbi:MAG: SUMF1/EgtB/PvdO family nonheme iron enzyme [Planctomycetota bacterium]
MTERTPPSSKRILEALRRWAKDQNVSQSELARRTGIPQPSISRYLAGESIQLRSAARAALLRVVPTMYLKTTSHSPDGQRGLATPSVFVSSTYLDNVERRRHVLDAITRAGFRAIGMEHFTADERETRLVCLEKVREADLYLGILAWRYGWIPPGTDKSITELEYDVAEGLDRLVFTIDSSSPMIPDQEMDPGVERWSKQERLERFKRRAASEQMSTPFTDEDLSVKVLQALQEWKERNRPSAATPPGTLASPESPDFDPSIATYLDAVASLHDSIHLAGFETRLRVPIRLEDLYVPLHAMVDTRALGKGGFGNAAEAEKGIEEGRVESLEIPLTEAFSHSAARGDRRGVVILGDPGSGKTTLLKRLLLWVVRRGSESLGLPADMVPVLLPLRDLESVSEGLDDLVDRTLASPHLRMEPGFGGRLLDRGNLLFLLDGLDEVADAAARAKVSRWIEDAVRIRRDCRFAVTCRYAGYAAKDVRLSPDLLELHLRPLRTEQAEQFVHNWFRIVETGSRENREQAESIATEKANELVERLHEPDFRARRVFELTRNPLLLTAICLVQRDRGRLPRRRAELYDECINVLLERWREAKKLDVRIGAASARQILQPLAYWMHREEGRTRARGQDLAPVVDGALATVAEGEKVGPADRFLATIRDESGLLTGWSGESYGFLHLGFQEYLAAQEIRGRAYGNPKPLEDLADHFGESWWREVTLLLLALEGSALFEGLMREVVKRPAFAAHPDLVAECLDDTLQFSAAPFVDLLRLAPGIDKKLWARQLVALRVLEEKAPKSLVELKDALFGHPSKEIAERARKIERIIHLQAATLGTAVVLSGKLTVRRPADRGGYELVKIPAGKFLMGSPESDEQGFDDERPQHEVVVPEFYLGAYPVTNEEYGRFLEANPKVKEPEYWGDRRYNQPRQPAVGVSWDEARLYCEWAGLVLPSEAQWEYACRAGTPTQYWSGDTEKELARVGWYEKNSGGRLHAVGEKPANDFGLYDTHGNVWEWCQDEWSTNYKKPQRVHPAAYESKGDGGRVVRGGSFHVVARFARSAFRFGWLPRFRFAYLGFRPARVITE